MNTRPGPAGHGSAGRDIAVVAFAQSVHRRSTDRLSEVELVMPVLQDVLKQTGLTADRIGFTCSGSSDYLAGRAFSFTMALDGVGAWPPISESHVEMDGAWALYEAWVKLRTGQADTALVYSYGKSSPGSVRDVLTRQLDPYTLAPLWPDAIALAALQAQALVQAGLADERDFAETAVRSRRAAAGNPHAQLRGSAEAEELLLQPYQLQPLRRHDCPPISDGAAAVILAVGDAARALHPRPAWIRGIDHRIEAHQPGSRDLTESPSTRLAAIHAGAFEPGRSGSPIDTAELHAPFAPQELILRRALDLNGAVEVNPSGGALAANPVMAAGLLRIGEAAARIHRGESRRALAHATSGPCLQQNLVAVLEGDL